MEPLRRGVEAVQHTSDADKLGVVCVRHGLVTPSSRKGPTPGKCGLGICQGNPLVNVDVEG